MRPKGAVDHGHWAGVEYHHQLLDDPFRMDAYDRAIRALVRPGMRVLDLGCGTGVLSLLAARRGAVVHAVESTPIVRVAEALARSNGLADRITFHAVDAEHFDAPEPVDLVISDFMGRFVVDDQMLAAARRAARWLAPGGRFAPSRIRLRLAPVACRLRPWEVFSTGLYGLDLSAALPLVVNNGWAAQLRARDLLGEPALYATIDAPYRVGPFDATLRFTLRSGRLQGLAGWFEADLAPGITLSTAPEQETHWGQYVFPLEAVDVDDGDVLDAHVSFDEANAEWHWEGELRTAAGTRVFRHASEPRHETRELTAAAAPAVDRSVALALHERALARFHAGDARGAAVLWEESLRALPPDDPAEGGIYENVGIARLNAGDDGPAVRALLRALADDPTRAQARTLLRTAFERAGYPLAAARS